MKTGLQTLFFFLLIFPVFGQNLTISLEKEEIQIGEQFVLTYGIKSDFELKSVEYAPHQSTFPAKTSAVISNDEINTAYSLEIVKPFEDTNYQEGGSFIWKGKYLLTAWDSAYVIIPPESIKINDSLYSFPAGLLGVDFPKVDPTKPIYDIRESFTELPDEDFSFAQFLLKYGWTFILLVVFIVLIFIYLKKKKTKNEIQLDLRERTLQKIELLERSRSYEQNLKEYYFELSIIIRRFLADFYDSPIMDKTTLEIEALLKENQTELEVIKQIEILLSQSDMVKFARSKPAPTEIARITNNAKDVVNRIFNSQKQPNE